MASSLRAIVMDAGDAVALGGFSARVLGWKITADGPDEVAIASPEGYPPEIVFVSGAGPKSGQNRVHLDLRSGSEAELNETVDRAIGLGAKPLDIGQGDVPWAVLGDPDGNELCVLEPRPDYEGTGIIAAIVVTAENADRLGSFWSKALDWPVVLEEDGFRMLRGPDLRSPFLEFVEGGSGFEQDGKNRVHLDIGPVAGSDQAAEVAHVEALGARPAEIGQSKVDWVVMADPEGNEFCVLAT